MRNGRAFLADRAVDADHISALLVNDRVQNDGGLAGLPVPNDQFALAAADRDHGVDGLDAGLQRLAYGLPVHYAGGNAFDGIVMLGNNGSFAVERHAERIHDTPDERVANRSGHDGPCALDRVALFDGRVFAEQHGADLVFLEVERDAINIVRKLQHLAGHNPFQTMNTRYAVANGDDCAYLFDGDRLVVIRDLRAKNFGDLVRSNGCHACFAPDFSLRLEPRAQPLKLRAY